MEKVKTFFKEKERNSMAMFLSAKGWCIHTYRYVAGGGLVYCVKYWK